MVWFGVSISQCSVLVVGEYWCVHTESEAKFHLRVCVSVQPLTELRTQALWFFMLFPSSRSSFSPLCFVHSWSKVHWIRCDLECFSPREVSALRSTAVCQRAAALSFHSHLSIFTKQSEKPCNAFFTHFEQLTLNTTFASYFRFHFGAC